MTKAASWRPERLFDISGIAHHSKAEAECAATIDDVNRTANIVISLCVRGASGSRFECDCLAFGKAAGRMAAARGVAYVRSATASHHRQPA